MIELKNVCAGYGKKDVLNNISFAPEEGKITGIIGPNGCGKSTLLKTVVRLADKRSGEIFVDGKTLESYKSAELAKAVSYLPQSKKAADMSVSQIVLHGRFPYLEYPRRYRKVDIQIATDVMKQMELLDIKDKNLNELSGGQRQKAYIAMALAQGAPVILMDEPTTYLDIAHQLRLCKIIRNLADMGKTVVVVLHDLTLAMSICDELCIMKDGGIIAKGTPDDLIETTAPETAFGIKLKKISDGRTKRYVYDI